MPAISVALFAKYPEAGAVKTRMVPPLTAAEAAEVHRLSLLATLEELCGFGGLEISLAVTPDDRVAAMAELVSEYPVDIQPQGDGDLGQRLTRMSQQCFRQGADGVILLGADSPTMPGDFLSQAIAHMACGHAVLGPCDDGGYYLLALPAPMPMLFKRIPWGTSQVAEQTRARAAEAGIILRELPRWYDLDRYEDLARGARDLAVSLIGTSPCAEELEETIAKLSGR